MDTIMKRTDRLLTYVAMLIALLLSGCQDNSADSQFPVLGEVTKEFTFRNQDGQEVTNALFDGKIVIPKG